MWRLVLKCGCCCLLVPCFCFTTFWLAAFSLISFRHEETVLAGPFNDGGCELLAEDLIRGGSSVKLWRDGVAIVSAGDFNTTHRHYARGARGVGLFAVDLKASPRPTVRKLELLDWPEASPQLVGQGLFISNSSGRLYVVNHNHRDEQEPLEELEYDVGEWVQGLCCCCGWGQSKYSAGVITQNLGGGTYTVKWYYRDRKDTMLARQLRKWKLGSRHEWPDLDADPSCPFTEYHSEKLSQSECSEAEGEGLGILVEPFLQYLEDAPAGCFVRGGHRIFNLHPNGSRRAGCRSVCKRVDGQWANEEKIPVGIGEEEEFPESYVEVFEIMGDDFRSLRLRHLDRIASDYFPYQGITQVLEGRSSEELYVLRELPWRSTPHEHNAVLGSRNHILPSHWMFSATFWWLRSLGMPTAARNQVWMNRNKIRLAGGGPWKVNHGYFSAYRYTDTVSTKGADVTVLRCTRLQPHGLEVEGVPVRGGIRWNCSRTEAHGLPIAKGFAISPNRTDLLLGVDSVVIRYRIQEDGELKEVGLTGLGAKQGVVSGLAWEEADKILYSLLPVPALTSHYLGKMLSRPGLPWELAVGEPPVEGRVGRLANALSVYGPSPDPMPLLMRHDGSLIGRTTSWVRRAGAVLVGSEWEEGLLYCPKVQPLDAPELREGDRVWAQDAPSLGAWLGLHGLFMRTHLYRGQEMSYWRSKGKEMMPAWRTATVLGSGGGGVHVALDEAPRAVEHRSVERLRPIFSARQPLRRGERVRALHASGEWKGATIVEDHGDGNVTVTWDDEVLFPWFVRRREADDEIRVRLSPNGSSDTHGQASPAAPSEGSCSPKDADNASSCPSVVQSASAGTAEERPSWEVEVADGFYEVTLLFRQEGAAGAESCMVEGHVLKGTGSVLVEVKGGRLTLGGCSGLVESLVLRMRPEEEALATPFFHGPVGSYSYLGRFETHVAVEHEEGFLRRLPAGLTAENTTIVATIRGGSCGARATVRFQVDAKTLRYFQHGRQAGWRPLREVRDLTGRRAPAPPARIFTGEWDGEEGASEGWALDSGSPLQTFAGNFEQNTSSPGCNSRALTGGEMVTLSYLAGPPRVSKQLHPELKVGDLAEVFNPFTLNMSDVRITGHNADGTFLVEHLGGSGPNITVKERRLPVSRLQRTQAGFRRVRVANRPFVCSGYTSWSWTSPSEEDCLRQCEARPLCRFAAYTLGVLAASPWDTNCHTSTNCSEVHTLGGESGGLASFIFEKLDPEPAV